MAKLVFRVQADWEEVVKLRNEIDKLKKELKSICFYSNDEDIGFQCCKGRC